MCLISNITNIPRAHFQPLKINDRASVIHNIFLDMYPSVIVIWLMAIYNLKQITLRSADVEFHHASWCHACILELIWRRFPIYIAIIANSQLRLLSVYRRDYKYELQLTIVIRHLFFSNWRFYDVFYAWSNASWRLEYVFFPEPRFIL